jgi:hypothetical protein
MSIIHVKHSSNFTIIDNAVIRDSRISLRARGLHHLLLSFPHDWEISIEWLLTQCSEGRNAIYAALAELEESGYLRRYFSRDRGRFAKIEYEIYEHPLPIDPCPGDPFPEIPIEQMSLPLEDSPYPDLPYTVSPHPVNPPHTNNVFNKDDLKKDLSLSAPTKTVERENFQNFSNNPESPAKTSVESRSKDKSRRAASTWANLDDTFKNFCWQQVDKLPIRPADPIAWILSRLEHLEAEYQRLYPQTASPDSRYAKWEAILTDPFKGMTHLLTVGIDQTSPEYEERYQFAVAYQRRRR